MIVLAGCALVAACDGKKTSPTAPGLASNQALKLDIVGPNRLEGLGTKTQLLAQLTFGDGSKKDCGSQCRWWVDDTHVAAVNSGFVMALAPGRTTVYAEGGGYQSSIDITIVPADSYVLDGVVKEPGDLPIDSASIEIVGGRDNGKRTTSTSAGYFVFFGVSGNVQMSVSKPGYVTQSVPLTVTRDSTRDVELQPVLPIGAFGGDYRLTLKVAPGCQLPAEARTREYSAHIVQSGARLDVALSGAGLATTLASETFSGHVSGNQVTFDLLVDTYYGIYPFVDKLSDTLYMVIYGEATGEGQRGIIQSTLNGAVEIYTNPPWRAAPTLKCNGSHQLIFASTSATSQRR
jgi:hypothetical protein